MTARIYQVKAKEGDEITMVKASNQAQAIRHVARNTYTVTVASAVTVADHLCGGGKIEIAHQEENAA